MRAAYAPLRSRLANSRNGMIGCSARASLSTSAVSRAAPTTRPEKTRAEPQPYSADSMIPNTSAPTPSVAHTAPVASNRPRLRGVSVSTLRAPTIMATAIGTLTRKAARQETRSVSAPPTSRPRLAPMPAVAPYQAMARLRVSPSKYAVMRASEVGATIAAPTPWNARAAMIHQPVWARPIIPDAAPKIARPTTNSRRRPTMSPARAPSSSRPPNTRV